MFRLIPLFPILIITSLSQCLPGYYQVNSTYQPPTNQLYLFSQKPFFLEDISRTVGVITNRTIYTIRNITVFSFYNGGNKSIKVGGEEIMHSGELIEMVMSFVAEKNKKDFTAYGTDTLRWLAVNYTVKAEIKDNITYNISALNYRMPQTSQIGPYDPDPTQADKQVFNDMIKTNLSSQLFFIYSDSYIQQSLFGFIRNQSIWPTLPSPSYSYHYKTLQYPFNTTITSFSLSNPKGYILGLDSSLPSFPVCSNFTPSPDSPSATYISLSLINSVLSHTIYHFPDWDLMWLNSKNTFSNMFQFYEAQLEYVLPTAVTGDLELQTKVKCLIDKLFEQTSLTILENSISAVLRWKCGLYADTTYPTGLLLEFSPRIKYEVEISQNYNVLQVVITNVKLQEIQWTEVGYKLERRNLAELYLRSVLKEYVGLRTVGTGFQQPIRVGAVTQYFRGYVMIHTDYQSTVL